MCVSNASFIERNTKWPKSAPCRLCLFNLPYYCFLLFIDCVQHTHRKRWNNCRLRNHHFGIYEHLLHALPIVWMWVCVCNEVVRSIPQCSVCWKWNVAQMRLTKLGGSSNVFGYMHSARMTNITNRFLCSILHSRNVIRRFGGRAALHVRSKISRN